METTVASTDIEETKTDVPKAKESAKPRIATLDNNKIEEETKETQPKEDETKDDTKCSDSDSDDGQSEEDRQKEIEERQKLLLETEKHKTKMAKIILALIGIETIICAILMSLPSDVIVEDPNNYLKSRIFNFRHDTVDVICASVFRLVVLYGFVTLAITWGNVKTYDSDLDKHTIFNTKTSHYKLVTQLKANAAFIVLQLWKRIIGLNQYANMNASVSNNGYTSLLPQNDGRSNNTSVDKKTKVKKLFDLQEFVNKYAGMDAQDVSDVWKTVIWMVLFFMITVCTTITGIKISFFQCIDSSNNCGYYYYIALFAAIIILTHLQTYFVKKYIDDCCKPVNRYLDTRIHPHPMFKTKNRGRSCQLCWQRPGQNSTKRQLIYKCLQCPQHRAFVCVKCWNKKRKEARLREKEKLEKELLEIGSDNDKDVTFKEYFTTLLKYHLPYIHLLLFGVIAMGVTSVIRIFVPKQKGQLLDRLIAGDLDGFYMAIKMQLFLTVLQGIISCISNQTMGVVSQQITCDLQKRMFQNLMAQDMVFFDNHTTAEINERMNWGLSEMLSPFQSTIRTVLSSFVSLIGSLYMCLTISWRLTFLGLSTLGPMSYFMQLFARWNWQRNLVQRELQREMYGISYHGFEHIRAVRAFAKEHEFVRYYSMLRQESHDTDNRKRVTQSINSIINSWFRLGTKLLLTWIAGMIVLNNGNESSTMFKTNLTVGLFITFETYWQTLYGTIRSIRGTVNTYDHAFFMAKKIFRTLEKKTEIEHLAIEQNNVQKMEDKLINEIDGNIAFEDVEFYYESSPNKLVLKSINLEIEKGKTTALVGRSGGGKSTIMHLILRFYDPTKGRITLNEIDLKKYNPYSLRRQIALVSQDTELFTKSVEYNIGFGANKQIKDGDQNAHESAYNLKEVEYSAKLANAHKFISEMEEKYDTQMGTRAKRCSGGQKQRISIARMLMSQPKVMLLDEATSSLDAESEALVQAAMERESEEKNCTLVIVAHRLSTVVNADKICVVDDGSIVEEGTHEELIDLKGIYASLVERQINLRTKMKQKLENMKKGIDGVKDGKGGGGSGDSDDDFDNIDKLIDQIKADKLKKEMEKKNTGIEEIKT